MNPDNGLGDLSRNRQAGAKTAFGEHGAYMK